MEPPRLRGSQASSLRHWAPSSPRLDLTAEPLIEPGSVVGFWPLQHWQAVPWHDHEFYEIAFVVQGSGFHFAGEREVRIGPGSVIFVPPGTAHGYRALRGVAVYNCFFRAELAEFELLWAARDTGLTTLFGGGTAFREPGDHVVLRLDDDDLTRCVAALDNIRNRSPIERSHAFEIGHLLIALDVLVRSGISETNAAAAPRAQASRVVSRAMELIETDLARPWTLATLAGEVYVTTFYLAHQFKKWVGVPPVAYIHRRRAQHAAFLLSGTDEPIGSIGQGVGWADPAAFSHQFRRAYGMSPREYRKRARQANATKAEATDGT